MDPTPQHNSQTTTNAPQRQGKVDNMPIYNAQDLFGTARTVIIRHAGEEYRLSITRQGRLILTK